MFCANENTLDKIGSMLAGAGMSCYDIIELPGFSPIFLVEMPIFDEKGKIESRQPIIVNRIGSIISLKDGYEAPLDIVNVWMLFPGFMNNSEGWQVQRITSIWEGTWKHKKDLFTMTKVELANGESVHLNGMESMQRVDWVQLL